MRLLDERIAKDGRVYPGNILKVDSFLNHQIDIKLSSELAKEFYNHFKHCNITKILTIEASGIAIASLTALQFDVPMVFAKKSKTANISNDYYTAKVASYTHGTTHDIIVIKQYLTSEDTVLIVDDFLANGQASEGLISLVEQSGAKLAGIGILVEKAFQNGGKMLRDKGIDVYSLSRIASIDEQGGRITFCD